MICRLLRWIGLLWQALTSTKVNFAFTCHLPKSELKEVQSHYQKVIFFRYKLVEFVKDALHKGVSGPNFPGWIHNIMDLDQEEKTTGKFCYSLSWECITSEFSSSLSSLSSSSSISSCRSFSSFSSCRSFSS